MAEYASGPLGWTVAVQLSLSNVTVAGTSVLEALRNSMVAVLIVDVVIDSLNETVATAVAATFAAFATGVTELTTGGVVSGAADVAQTTSTQ